MRAAQVRRLAIARGKITGASSGRLDLISGARVTPCQDTDSVLRQVLREMLRWC
jgi:hypothetical protein